MPVGLPGVLHLLSVPALAVTGYLGMLGAIASRSARTRKESPAPASWPHFTFVVPAHNESAGIARTVSSLRGVDYPAERFRILVVADNCTDDTASRAGAVGAEILERQDPTRRGKGYALELAFGTLLAGGDTDAAVVVDADSDVSANFLREAASRLLAGETAMQAHYAVRNVEDSWRTRLMDVAFTLYHGVRSHAREALGVSVGLRGNGMVFALSTLRAVPYGAYSLVEDVEYGIELALKGIRVAYLGHAKVLGEMVADAKSSESQRKRWEDGRRQLLRQYLPKLLGRAVRERNLVLLDLACDILVPPLSTVALYVLAGGATSAVLVGAGVAGPSVVVPWAVATAGLLVYVGSGIAESGRGLKVLADLAHVPEYVLWKLTLPLRSRASRSGEWIRTARNDGSK